MCPSVRRQDDDETHGRSRGHRRAGGGAPKAAPTACDRGVLSLCPMSSPGASLEGAFCFVCLFLSFTHHVSRHFWQSEWN